MTVVYGISMVKDEEDILPDTLDWMTSQVDGIIVADNMSTDRTPEILGSYPDVTVLPDLEPGYYQSYKMSHLAQIAHSLGADWVVPFDADEIWYSPFGTIKDVLAGVGPQWLVASAELYDHVPTRIDVESGTPLDRIGWRRRHAVPLPKVACRTRRDLVIEQGNHGAWYEGGATIQKGLLVVRHFPYRSPEQFVKKAKNGAAAYKAAADLPHDVGAHWRGYGAIANDKGDEEAQKIFWRYWWSEDPENDPTLIYDPAPVG